MANSIPTFADLCRAIADGHLPVVQDGSTYQVNASDLRRYVNKLRPLPTISYLSSNSLRSAFGEQEEAPCLQRFAV